VAKKTKIVTKTFTSKKGKEFQRRVAILPNGQWRFLPSKGSSKSSSKPKTKKLKVTKIEVETKNKKGSGNTGSTFHWAAFLGFIGYPASVAIALLTRQITPYEAIGLLTAGYTGVNAVTGQVQPGAALINYGSIGIGAAASKIAAMTKVNSLLPKHCNI